MRLFIYDFMIQKKNVVRDIFLVACVRKPFVRAFSARAQQKKNHQGHTWRNTNARVYAGNSIQILIFVILIFLKQIYLLVAAAQRFYYTLRLRTRTIHAECK